MLGVGVAAVFQTFNWESSAGWVSGSHHTLELIGHAQLRSSEADENARVLALEFRDDAAANCRRALSELRNIATEIRQSAGADPAVKRTAEALFEAATGQMQAFNAGLDTKDAEGMRRALMAYDRSQTSVHLHEALTTLEQQQRVLLGRREQLMQSSAVRTRQLFELAAMLSLLLILVAGWRASMDSRRRTDAEKTLAAREEQYRQVVENAGDIIYRTDVNGRFTFCNQTALTMLHLTEKEVMGRSYLKLVRTDKRRETERFYLRQFARKRRNSYYEFPVIDGHGRERWLGQNVQVILENGEPVGFQAIAREITERRKAETELTRSRAFVERIAATTPGILYVYDLNERRTVFSNKEVTAVLGYKPEELQSIPDITALFHPDDAPAIGAHHQALRLAQDGEVRRIEFRVRHADGHWVWLSSRDTPFERGKDGMVKRTVGIAQDITERRTAQEKLTYQANYDAVSGLPNRHFFWNSVQNVLRRTSIEQSTASLCIFDIDHFKEINDRHGHAAGDEVLEAIGGIVRSELRNHDFAGRLGGDEFSFILPATDHDEAARVAERMRERLTTMAFGLSAGSPFSVTATFGVAEWEPQMDAKALMEAADRALYRAKSSGRNRVCVDA